MVLCQPRPAGGSLWSRCACSSHLWSCRGAASSSTERRAMLA